MTDPDRRIRATYALDLLDAATAELAHWLSTGERVTCPRCAVTVPAKAPGVPARHQARGQWCTPSPTNPDRPRGQGETTWA